MAGKHSKSFFDTVKDIFTVQIAPRNYAKSKTSLPFNIVTVALIISLMVCAIFVGGFFLAGNTQAKITAQAKDCFDSIGGNATIEELSKINPDIKGWINIKDTDISYAVCQGKDDKYYTNHNQNGKKSRYGALALSSADSFERTGDDKNIVIFGNNMKDGAMFGSLKKYRNLNFYKQNPYIELYYGQKKEKYIVFSIMLIGSHEQDSGDIYNPAKSHFADEQEFDLWYGESTSRSLINTKVVAEYGDEMLTLVTTADDFEGARLVVLAKKIADRDDFNIDVSDAVVNAKIKYPKIWYIDRGLEYPY